ncbi:MAG TPA: hypothetical protein VNE39_06820 [Planctomycetota bacterium]|nr:hypothetical protein [Planctomycetota bacterium]
MWDGPKLKAVPRNEVFELSRPPTFRRVVGPDGKPLKDRYEIAFAAKDWCDVAVAIEDARGRIVNHLVYGVLGPNAPEPLKPASLEQVLLWNGKDDFGQYVQDPQTCRARVSLGLKASFDRLIGWHPKDTTGPINGIGADPDGVYVLSAAGYWQGIKMYDHEGNYVRTLLPFAADRIAQLKGVATQQLLGQPLVPAARTRYGKMMPYETRRGAYTIPVVSQGRIAWPTHGYNELKRILRIGTDGTTRGEDASGPILAAHPSEFMGGTEMAASPDGRWLYITKLCPDPRDARLRPRHAVFRMEWDAKGPLPKRAFLGEADSPDSDSGHLKFPEGVACDSQGRIYVSDYGNDRIQVFDPEGKFLHTLRAKWPRQIAVHQKTGEIYYTSFGPKYEDAALVKLSPLPAGAERARLDLATLKLPGAEHDLGDFKSHWNQDRLMPIFCLDSWATPATVWLVPAESRITLWADRGEKFELLQDFDEEMRRDGYTPHAFNGYKMNRVCADPVRGHLYYLNSLAPFLLRCDPEVGTKWDKIRVPASGWRTIDDFQVGADGYLYMRTPLYLARFDPGRIVSDDDRDRKGYDLVIPATAEVPFDYGEAEAIGWSGKAPVLRGVIKLPAQIRGNGFDMGMGVAPNGNVLAFCQNYQDQTDRIESKGTTVPKLFEDRYRPVRFPGRLWGQGGLIWVWDRNGQLIGEDLIKAMHGASCGVRSDKQGNLYVGFAAWPLRDGERFLPARHTDAGPGALLKFPPAGGKIIGTWAGGVPVPLKELPRRPPEFECMGKLWTQGLLWSYPGMSTMTITTNTCTCPQCRFDTDLYGRSFIPESWRYSVGVCDTNGNPVLHIGRYGNPDSGRGPDSAVVVEGGIAFSQCDFVSTVSDRWLYVADTGNWRVVRLRLGYHVEATVPLVE